MSTYYLASNNAFFIVINQCIQSVTDGLEDVYTHMVTHLCTHKHVSCSSVLSHVVAIYPKGFFFCHSTLLPKSMDRDWLLQGTFNLILKCLFKCNEQWQKV